MRVGRGELRRRVILQPSEVTPLNSWGAQARAPCTENAVRYEDKIASRLLIIATLKVKDSICDLCDQLD